MNAFEKRKNKFKFLCEAIYELSLEMSFTQIHKNGYMPRLNQIMVELRKHHLGLELSQDEFLNYRRLFVDRLRLYHGCKRMDEIN